MKYIFHTELLFSDRPGERLAKFCQKRIECLINFTWKNIIIITEKKDNQGNTIFTGEVKNIGGRRADFVKMDFVFRKNWSGETKTLTTFARGTYHTFDSGITTDATLLPGSVGAFELYVPHAFGSFIGYSYVIDWEEYE